MSDTRPVKAPLKMPKAKANGHCKHNPQCSLFESIAALSLRFDTLAKQLEAASIEERRRSSEQNTRHAGDIYDLRNRTTLLEQREERLEKLLQDATRVMAEDQVVIAAATLAIKEARHA